MSARPVRAEPIKTERKDGKLYVTLEFERPGWQRFLGSNRYCRRTFGLDPYGEEVYMACDGGASVRRIVKGFAARHHISPAEAEISVSRFLKTLMTKGLVGMAVSETGSGKQGRLEKHG
jgi:hypothetical protein